MNILKKILIVLIPAIVLFGCKKEDFTGESSQVPTNPIITVDLSSVPTSAVSDIQKSSYVITLNMDVAQIVDVKVYVNLDETSTATAGEDFAYDGTVVIKAGRTSAKLNVSVLSDELLEGNESFKLTIGDERTANATITPVSATFTIVNGTETQLGADLTWTTDVLDAIGLDLDPEEVVDLRMLIIDSNDDIVEVIDGSAFESYSGFDTLVDGNYKIAVDIFETIDAGQFNSTITLDLSIEFNQTGLINGEVLSFPAVMTNSFVCETYRVYLATVTKTGNTFTMQKSISVPSSIFSGLWFGIDTNSDTSDPEYLTYPSAVVVELGCNLEITGLGFGWMTDFWGEEIIDGGTVSLEVDEVAGTVAITDQYYMQTTWNGAVQTPYNIVGTGTYDDSGTYPTISFTYDLVQDGFSTAGWCFTNGYLPTDKFVATLTLDPATDKVIKKSIKRPAINKSLINR